MNHLKLLSLVFATGLSPAFAQINVFQESTGTVSTTTSLVQHDLQNGFDNDAFVFGDGNAANPVDVRGSSSSAGSYMQADSVGASGGANLWFGSSGERGFSLTGVRAAAFDSLGLYFAYRKESATSNADFRIDWSSDDWQNWDSISVSGYLPADAASSGWYYIGPVFLPANAATNNLALRWIKSGGSMRIDDILLRGIVASPFIQCDASELDFLSYSLYSASAWQSISLESYGFQAGDSIFLQCSSPFTLATDTQNMANELVIIADSDYFEPSIWIRMDAADLRGIYDDSLFVFYSGSDTLKIELNGYSYFAGELRSLWECETDTISQTPGVFETGSFEQGNNNGTTQFISSSVASDSYAGASGGNNAALAVATGVFDALSSAYIGWYLKPDSNTALHILGLSFGSRSTSTGPQSWCLRSSADGFSANLFQGTLTANSSWNFTDTGTNADGFSISDSTYFRLYLYDGSGSASINIANFRLDDLELELASWKIKSQSNFLTAASGNFHDSSIWTYNYFDTLYRDANDIPNMNPSTQIREQDSIWLTQSDTLGALVVSGKLALAGHDLSIDGALTGNGEIIGHRSSGLYLEGESDSSILRLSSDYPGQSNALAELSFNCPSGFLGLIDTVYVHGWVNPQAGTLSSTQTLHLLQGEEYAAQIIPGGGGYISGALCMQTLIPGQAAGWRSFFSPLDTVSLGQLGTQIEIHLTNTASSGDNRNAFEWSETAASWNAVNDPSFNLHEKAVHLYVFNPDSSIIELCGLYDTSDVSFGQLGFTSGNSQNEGWHLIGNPYPSPIRWSKISLPAGTNGNYAVWSEYDGNYRPWNGATGSAGDLIPPFQGFWVKVNQALNEDFVLKNEYRDTGNINHFGKNGELDWQLSVRLSGNSGYNDGIELFFPSDSNSLLRHAPKLPGLENAPQIWIETDAIAWSIRRYQGEDKIPLILEIPGSGNYNFAFNETISGWNLYDERTNKTYAISNGGNLELELEQGRHSKRFYLQHHHLSVSKTRELKSPQVIVKDKFLHIQAPGIRIAEIFQMDARALHSYEALIEDESCRFGPLAYSSGLYMVRFNYEGQIHSQIFYLP